VDWILRCGSHQQTQLIWLESNFVTHTLDADGN
jgi:hypothetical protein